MTDDEDVKARQTSRDTLLVAAVLAIGAAVVSSPVAGADKSKSSRRAKDDFSSNDSIRTQQQTADAFADKLHSSKPTSRPSESIDDLKDELSDLNAQIRTEDDRHAAALADLKKSAKTSKGKNALDKEQSAYEQRRAALDEQRDAVLVKLNDRDPSAATTKPTTAPTPRSKKPSKSVSGNTRAR